MASDENCRCAIFYITPTAEALQVQWEICLSHYTLIQTDFYSKDMLSCFISKIAISLLLFHRHTLTKPFPQILITFSSPEILSLKQSLFIFTCNSVSLSEHPEITLLLSVEHLSWVCSQHWHNDSVIPKHNDWLSRPRFHPALCYHPNICHFLPWFQHLGQVNAH